MTRCVGSIEQSRAKHLGVATFAALILITAGVTACSGGSNALSADSTCRQYLNKDVNTRHDAAMRISAQLHAEDGGNPMWGLNTDYVCNNNPSLKLRAAFGRSTSAASGAPAAAPSETTDTPTVAASPATSAAPTNPLGQTVLSSDTVTNLCTATANTSASSGQVAELLTGGVAILNCTDGLTAVDVPTGSVLWTRALASSANAATDSTDAGPTTTETLLSNSGGGRNVYLLAMTTVPASGLADGYITRTITALDPHTGTQSWTQPLEPEDKQDTTSDGSALETPGPMDGSTQVIVNLDAYSAFDAASGKPEWRTAKPDTNPTYVGYNLALSTDSSNSPEDTFDLIATNLATGKTSWTDQLADSQSVLASSSGFTGQLVGHTYWTFSDTGYDTFNILTGQQTGHALFPTAWTHTLATPDLIATYVDGTLRLFHTGNWTAPIWSVSAADTSPLAITSKALLVQAPSGNLVLNASDGSIISRDVALSGNASQDQLVDGLLNLGDSVLELAPPG